MNITTPRLYVLDEQGEPVHETDVARWSRWVGEAMYSHVGVIGQERLGDGHAVLVSTIFLAIDHNHTGESPLPLLWQTLILGGRHNGYVRLYATRAAAVTGHEFAFKLARTEPEP